MARTRSVSHIGDGTTLVFLYRRVNPSTGSYFTDADITACTVEVRNTENSGTALLAATAMVYDANLRGYRYIWTYGSSLTGISFASVFFSPTRAGSVAAALAPDEAIEIDLHDTLNRVAAVKTKTDSLTFTVAGSVDANVQHVNDIQVIGTGQSGSEWGPS